MLDFVPDTGRLAEIFSQATAPTFFLGAVAGFVSLMSSRLSAVLERTRMLNAIPENDQSRARLKSDLQRLRRRARLLKDGTVSSLWAAICSTALLIIIFVTEFVGLKYAYGAGLLFIIAAAFLGFALLRFAQEAQISLHEYDEQQL